MSRKDSREKVFQLVFEFCFSGEKNELSLENALSEIKSEDDKKYVSDVYLGVVQNFDVLKNAIIEKTTGFSFDRIFKVDLAIMLVALYEIRFYNIPEAVAINEAVDIAKKYSTEKSANYVNGVLAGLVKK